MRKRLFPILGIIAMLTLCLASVAMAEDIVLEAEVQSVSSLTTKNGAPYVRIIVVETKTLAGANYTVGTPVMAFRDMASKAEKYSAGDILKAIVSPREFQGKSSYLLRAVLK